MVSNILYAEVECSLILRLKVLQFQMFLNTPTDFWLLISCFRFAVESIPARQPQGYSFFPMYHLPVGPLDCLIKSCLCPDCSLSFRNSEKHFPSELFFLVRSPRQELQCVVLGFDWEARLDLVRDPRVFFADQHTLKSVCQNWGPEASMFFQCLYFPSFISMKKQKRPEPGQFSSLFTDISLHLKTFSKPLILCWMPICLLS